MKVFFLWRFYRQYLEAFHAQRPELEDLPFEEHRRILLSDHFGWQADLCHYLATQGHKTEFVVANAWSLQAKWAKEHGLAVRPPQAESDLIVHQVEQFRPDVLWLCSYPPYFGSLLRRLRPYARRVVLWVGEPWPTPPDLDGIDVLLTENPRTYVDAHDHFRHVVVTSPGIDPRIAASLGQPQVRRQVVFVGQFTRVHRRRTALVAALLRAGLPLEVFGTVDADPLPGLRQGTRLAAWYVIHRRDPDTAWRVLRRAFRPSPHDRDCETVRTVCRPPVFGMDMFRILAQARVVLNVHADLAGDYAGNMRLFEATCAGACLVTDHAANIEQLFQPRCEVLTFRDIQSCVDTVRSALADPVRTAAIARAGQLRTLRDHTIAAFYERVRHAVEF